MSYREVTHHVLVLLHTIVCERYIFGEIYHTPVQIDGVSFPWCWHSDAEKYFEKVGSCLKSVLHAQKSTKLILTVLRPWPNSHQVIERWTFTIHHDKTAKTDEGRAQRIQAVVDQISNSSTFLPPLEDGCVFKVGMYLNTEFAIPTTAKNGHDHTDRLSDPLVLRELEMSKYRLSIQASSM